MLVDTLIVLAELVLVGLAVVLGVSIGSRRRRELDEFEYEADQFITQITTEDDYDPAWQAPEVRQVITASTYLSDGGNCIDWVRDEAPVPVRIDVEEDRFAAAMRRADEFLASISHDDDVALPAAVQ